MRLLLYISFLISIYSVQALPSNWFRYTGGDTHYFKINIKDISIDGLSHKLSSGDYLGIFEVNGNVSNCVGLGRYYSGFTSDSMYITASKDTGAYFIQGNTYQIILWDSASNCQIVLKDPLSNNILYSGGFSDITSLNGSKLSVSYANNLFYTDQTLISVQKTDSAAWLRYKIYPTIGLSLDTTNGSISPQNSTVGNYEIKLYSDFCFLNADDTILIHIQNRPIIDTVGLKTDTLSISIKQQTCSENGSVKLINTLKNTMQTKLVNALTSDTLISPNGLFSNLLAGEYKLYLVNDTGRVWVYPNTILITLNCTNSVLDFTSPNANVQVYLETPGQAKIFNRDGVLVKNLTLPNYWDGTNNSGEPMPMGDYYVYVDGNQLKIITLLK